MKSTIAIIAEHHNGAVDPVTYEAVSFSVELGKAGLSRPVILLLGDDIQAPAEEAARFTGLDVIAVRAPGLREYNGHIFKEVLGKALTELNPSYVIASHTTQAADYAPALAVKLDAACVTSVIGVVTQADGVAFARSIMGGKLRAVVRALTDTTVLTVQPGAFSRRHESSTPGVVHSRTIEFSTDVIRRLGLKSGPAGDSNLSEAGVVVAAGRGAANPERLELIHKLAQLIPRSAVAGSRPLCDMDLLKYNRQVGLTGATIAPDLYMAIGVSGAQQHIVGMQGSGFVVAINTDPHAAMFNHADICIVEDLEKFLPELIAQLEGEEG